MYKRHVFIGPLSSPSPVQNPVQLPSLPSYDRHAGNIRTLLSPPESPEIASTYGSRQLQHQEERYIVPQTSEQQCACCVSRPVSIYQSSSYSQQSSSGVYDSSYSQQRYSSCPPLIHPIPISPFGRKPTLSTMQSLPRLNTSLLTPAAKHYGYHTDHFNAETVTNVLIVQNDFRDQVHLGFIPIPIPVKNLLCAPNLDA
ncbi:6515_t:CDS:2, partial [Racocetra fulgida]